MSRTRESNLRTPERNQLRKPSRPNTMEKGLMKEILMTQIVKRQMSYSTKNLLHFQIQIQSTTFFKIDDFIKKTIKWAFIRSPRRYNTCHVWHTYITNKIRNVCSKNDRLFRKITYGKTNSFTPNQWHTSI